MTVIACCKKNGVVAIASDSIATSGNLLIEHGSKLIKRKNYVIGYAGSPRTADILRESKSLHFDVNGIKDVRKFRDILYENMVSYGKCREESENSGTVMHPVIILIATKKGIYEIDQDYQIDAVKSYYSLGSGREYAFGAMFSLMQLDIPAKEIVKMAVDSAKCHCPTVGGRTFVKEL